MEGLFWIEPNDLLSMAAPMMPKLSVYTREH